MDVNVAKWEVVAKGKLALVGTEIIIEYWPYVNPYHVHRQLACHGAYATLKEAQDKAMEVVAELMAIGIDP